MPSIQVKPCPLLKKSESAHLRWQIGISQHFPLNHGMFLPPVWENIYWQQLNNLGSKQICKLDKSNNAAF
jgi:hypothetical protein